MAIEKPEISIKVISCADAMNFLHNNMIKGERW